MLKKPSAPVFSSAAPARPPSSSAMEVESTRVHVLADGKKLIDVTLWRPDKQVRFAQQVVCVLFLALTLLLFLQQTIKAALVVPQFEDESDESSSSGSEDGDNAHRGAPVYTSPMRRPQSGRHYQFDGGLEDNNSNNNSSESTSIPDQQATIPSEFKWDPANMNDIQQLTNANTQLVSQATEFKRQLKSYDLHKSRFLICCTTLVCS